MHANFTIDETNKYALPANAEVELQLKNALLLKQAIDKEASFAVTADLTKAVPTIDGDATIDGDKTIDGSATIDGGATTDGSAPTNGDATTDGDAAIVASPILPVPPPLDPASFCVRPVGDDTGIVDLPAAGSEFTDDMAISLPLDPAPPELSPEQLYANLMNWLMAIMAEAVSRQSHPVPDMQTQGDGAVVAGEGPEWQIPTSGELDGDRAQGWKAAPLPPAPWIDAEDREAFAGATTEAGTDLPPAAGVTMNLSGEEFQATPDPAGSAAADAGARSQSVPLVAPAESPVEFGVPGHVSFSDNGFEEVAPVDDMELAGVSLADGESGAGAAQEAGQLPGQESGQVDGHGANGDGSGSGSSSVRESDIRVEDPPSEDAGQGGADPSELHEQDFVSGHAAETPVPDGDAAAGAFPQDGLRIPQLLAQFEVQQHDAAAHAGQGSSGIGSGSFFGDAGGGHDRLWVGAGISVIAGGLAVGIATALGAFDDKADGNDAPPTGGQDGPVQDGGGQSGLADSVAGDAALSAGEFLVADVVAPVEIDAGPVVLHPAPLPEHPPVPESPQALDPELDSESGISSGDFRNPDYRPIEAHDFENMEPDAVEFPPIVENPFPDPVAPAAGEPAAGGAPDEAGIVHEVEAGGGGGGGAGHALDNAAGMAGGGDGLGDCILAVAGVATVALVTTAALELTHVIGADAGHAGEGDDGNTGSHATVAPVTPSGMVLPPADGAEPAGEDDRAALPGVAAASFGDGNLPNLDGNDPVDNEALPLPPEFALPPELVVPEDEAGVPAAGGEAIPPAIPDAEAAPPVAPEGELLPGMMPEGEALPAVMPEVLGGNLAIAVPAGPQDNVTIVEPTGNPAEPYYAYSRQQIEAMLDEEHQDAFADGLESGVNLGLVNGFNHGFDAGRSAGVREGFVTGVGATLIVGAVVGKIYSTVDSRDGNGANASVTPGLADPAAGTGPGEVMPAASAAAQEASGVGNDDAADRPVQHDHLPAVGAMMADPGDGEEDGGGEGGGDGPGHGGDGIGPDPEYDVDLSPSAGTEPDAGPGSGDGAPQESGGASGSGTEVPSSGGTESTLDAPAMESSSGSGWSDPIPDMPVSEPAGGPAVDDIGFSRDDLPVERLFDSSSSETASQGDAIRWEIDDPVLSSGTRSTPTAQTTPVSPSTTTTSASSSSSHGMASLTDQVLDYLDHGLFGPATPPADPDAPGMPAVSKFLSTIGTGVLTVVAVTGAVAFALFAGSSGGHSGSSGGGHRDHDGNDGHDNGTSSATVSADAGLALAHEGQPHGVVGDAVMATTFPPANGGEAIIGDHGAGLHAVALPEAGMPSDPLADQDLANPVLPSDADVAPVMPGPSETLLTVAVPAAVPMPASGPDSSCSQDTATVGIHHAGQPVAPDWMAPADATASGLPDAAQPPSDDVPAVTVAMPAVATDGAHDDRDVVHPGAADVAPLTLADTGQVESMPEVIDDTAMVQAGTPESVLVPVVDPDGLRTLERMPQVINDVDATPVAHEVLAPVPETMDLAPLPAQSAPDDAVVLADPAPAIPAPGGVSPLIDEPATILGAVTGGEGAAIDMTIPLPLPLPPVHPEDHVMTLADADAGPVSPEMPGDPDVAGAAQLDASMPVTVTDEAASSPGIDPVAAVDVAVDLPGVAGVTAAAADLAAPDITTLVDAAVVTDVNGVMEAAFASDGGVNVGPIVPTDVAAVVDTMVVPDLTAVVGVDAVPDVTVPADLVPVMDIASPADLPVVAGLTPLDADLPVPAMPPDADLPVPAMPQDADLPVPAMPQDGSLTPAATDLVAHASLMAWPNEANDLSGGSASVNSPVSAVLPTLDSASLLSVSPPVATLMLEFGLRSVPTLTSFPAPDAIALVPRLNDLAGHWMEGHRDGPLLHVTGVDLMPESAGSRSAFVHVDVGALPTAGMASPLSHSALERILSDVRQFSASGDGAARTGLQLEYRGVDLISGVLGADAPAATGTTDAAPVAADVTTQLLTLGVAPVDLLM